MKSKKFGVAFLWCLNFYLKDQNRNNSKKHMGAHLNFDGVFPETLKFRCFIEKKRKIKAVNIF